MTKPRHLSEIRTRKRAHRFTPEVLATFQKIIDLEDDDQGCTCPPRNSPDFEPCAGCEEHSALNFKLSELLGMPLKGWVVQRPGPRNDPLWIGEDLEAQRLYNDLEIACGYEPTDGAMVNTDGSLKA